MLTIAICDDSTVHREKNKEYLLQIGKMDDIEMDIRIFCDGEEILNAYKAQEITPDLIYMDIEMGALNGIETAKQLRDMDCRARLVFFTVSGDYVLDSMETNPEDYLRKDDISFEEFKEHFEKYYAEIQKEQASQVTVLKGEENFLCPMEEFLYFTMQEDICFGIIEQERIQILTPWQILILLGQERGFLLLNKKCLLQLCSIVKITEDKVYLWNGEAIPIEKGQQENVSRSLCEHLASL